MSTLYIDRDGTTLDVRGGITLINVPSCELKKVPVKYVSRVVVRSNATLTSAALVGFAKVGIPLLVMGGRSGSQVAQLGGAMHLDARKRQVQTLYLNDSENRVQFAKQIVRTKIRRQLGTIAQLQSARSDLRKPLFDSRNTLCNVLSDVAFQETATLDSIRGYEGAAAAAYFNAYFQCFAPSLGATRRTKRPPTDPVNATLSLAYTMLTSRAVNACWVAGLDPALGALHAISHGRPALACDLVEPFRPAVDLWVWHLFRSNTLRLEHFGTEGSGTCLLGKAGRGHFYKAWEDFAARQEQALLRYARTISRHFSALHENSMAWVDESLDWETQ